MGQKLFSITRADASVRLDAFGRGKLPFTVTNLTPRLLRSVVELASEKPAHASLLTLEGGRERTFQPNETQVVNVVVIAGNQAPPGEGRFGIKVVPVDYPDDAEEGPTAAFTVQGGGGKKRFPWSILAAAAVLLLLVAVAYYAMSDRGVRVADYKDRLFDEVRSELAAAGLKPKKVDEVRDPSFNPGRIVDQNIKNQKVKKGTTIEFVVALQRLPVVSVKGLPLEDAREKLESVGFISDKATYLMENEVAGAGSEGHVVSQNPDPDTNPHVTSIASGPISLKLGVTSAMAPVGRYEGLDFCDAIQQVTKDGFTIGAPTVNRTVQPKPRIIFAQNPAAGTQQPKGTPIALTLTLQSTWPQCSWNGTPGWFLKRHGSDKLVNPYIVRFDLFQSICAEPGVSCPK